MLMCTKSCRRIVVDCVVAPNHKDSQEGQHSDQSTASALVLCRDTDELSHGNKNLVLIDSYFKENWNHVSMSILMKDQITKYFPLYAQFFKYGIKIAH